MNIREWSRTRKLVSRFAILVVVALVFAKVAPTLAQEGTSTSPTISPSAASTPENSFSPSPSSSETLTATATPTPAPTLSPIPSSPVVSQILPVPNLQISGSPSPSPSPSALPMTAQKFQLGIPTSLPVDPRAHTLFMPSIKISGPQYSLVCISALHSNIDVYNRNAADSIFIGKRLVSGDLTPSVYVTGSTDQVSAIINGAGGLSISDPTQGIANEHIFIQLVAVSAPTLNPAFCGAGSPVNTRVIQIYPLGISIDTRKGDVTLKG